MNGDIKDREMFQFIEDAKPARRISTKGKDLHPRRDQLRDLLYVPYRVIIPQTIKS
jgi:hypothetical protein